MSDLLLWKMGLFLEMVLCMYMDEVDALGKGMRRLRLGIWEFVTLIVGTVSGCGDCKWSLFGSWFGWDVPMSKHKKV